MIESIGITQLKERLGFTVGALYAIRTNRLFSAYNAGSRLRFPLKKIENYEKRLLKEIAEKYKRKDIDFKFDKKKLLPFLISASEVREKWNITHSTQRWWVARKESGRYPSTTTIGKSRYFIAAEVDFIERGKAGPWRSRKSAEESKERIYK